MQAPDAPYGSLRLGAWVPWAVAWDQAGGEFLRLKEAHPAKRANWALATYSHDGVLTRRRS